MWLTYENSKKLKKKKKKKKKNLIFWLINNSSYFFHFSIIDIIVNSTKFSKSVVNKIIGRISAINKNKASDQ